MLLDVVVELVIVGGVEIVDVVVVEVRVELEADEELEEAVVEREVLVTVVEVPAVLLGGLGVLGLESALVRGNHIYYNKATYGVWVGVVDVSEVAIGAFSCNSLIPAKTGLTRHGSRKTSVNPQNCSGGRVLLAF